MPAATGAGAASAGDSGATRARPQVLLGVGRWLGRRRRGSLSRSFRGWCRTVCLGALGPAATRTARGAARLADQHAGDADVLGSEGQQRQLARPLERDIQRTLMRCACARLAARLDLAPVRQEPTQPVEVLVVDLFDLVDAELADLAARE